MELLVEIQVKNFDAFERFEKQACAIMRQYGGVIKHAYELERHRDGSGMECHIVSFNSSQDFTDYQNDFNLKALSQLRSEAIANTVVKPILRAKIYA